MSVTQDSVYLKLKYELLAVENHLLDINVAISDRVKQLEQEVANSKREICVLTEKLASINQPPEDAREDAHASSEEIKKAAKKRAKAE